MNVDQVKKLHQKKYRQELGFCLVEGEHLLLELEKTAIEGCELFVTASHAGWQSRFRKTVIGERQMAQISDTRSPQGMVAAVPVASLLQQTAGQTTGHCLYLHEVQDPGNLGTILRTLAWFGGWRCLLSPGSVDPFNPKVIRSSMGAIFHVPLELDVTLDTLNGRFSRIATLDMAGAPLASVSSGHHDCFVFGNEARGIPREALAAMSATAYTIAGSGLIESLNLASVVNMCVYELGR
jgi:RNA methyltransferase, TrmH family